MAFKTERKGAWGKKSGGSSDSGRVFTLQVAPAKGPACAIEIAGNHTLEQLHEAILDGFGLRRKTSWEFQAGGRGLHDRMNRRYGPAGLEDDQLDDASQTTIEDLKLKEGKTFGYISDRDHPAEYSLEVVKIERAGRGLADPRVVGSVAPARPPEPETRPAKPARAKDPAAPPARDALVALRDAPPAARDALVALRDAPPAARDALVALRDAPPAAREGQVAFRDAPPAARDAPAPVRDAQAAACSYLLVGLIQRLDAVLPGLAKDLLAGIHADRAAIGPETPDRQFVETIFSEALKTVGQAVAGRS